MRKRLVMFGMITAFVMGLGIGSAEAATIEFKESVSGSFLDTVIDANGDGLPANQVLAGGKGTFGPSSINGLAEAEIDPAADCGPGSLGTRFVAMSLVHRFKNGDLLYSLLSEGGGCLDLATFVASGAITMTVIGGTGRFEGATGEYVFDLALAPLLITWVPSPNIVFGAATGEIEGVVYTVGD